MKPRTFQLTLSIASSGLTWIARWMLVLLLAADLIGSPFHAHHHDGGAQGYASHTMEQAADDTGGLDHDAQHADADDPGVNGGHSLCALRGGPVQLAHPEARLELHGVVPLFALAGLLTQPDPEVDVGWRPGRDRVPIPSFRTVPPNGRAPPPLVV